MSSTMSGYPQFATLLGKFPELMMYRKFDELSAKLLLYQQADLVNLEQKLKWIESAIENDVNMKELNSNREKLVAAYTNGTAVQHRELVREVEEKMAVYHRTLLRVSQVQTLPAPTSHNRRLVSDWLITPEGGNDFLKAFEPTPWWPENDSDLISLMPPPNDFDQWLARRLTPILHIFGRRKKSDTPVELGIGSLWEYKHKTFVLIATVLAIFCSSAFPIVSITALLYVRGLAQQLGMITAFTVLFSILVSFVTRCRRAELFAATAAFAAVEVVFLQGINCRT